MTRNSESTNNSMNNGCGFFLLMLLVGAVSVMVLPSVLYPPHNKCSHTSEAMQYIGAMNRAQQAIFKEENAFATSVDALGMGIKTETYLYKYSVSITKQAAFNYGVSKRADIRSYVGGVFLIPVKPSAAKNEIKTETILCVADNPGTFSPLRPILQSGKLVCGYGTAIGKK